MKRCLRCEIYKVLSDFRSDKSEYCKQCRSRYIVGFQEALNILTLSTS